VISFESGLGRARLDDGRIVAFDPMYCHGGLPRAGSIVEVTFGISRLGREIVDGVWLHAEWATLRYPAIVLHDWKPNVEVLYLQPDMVTRDVVPSLDRKTRWSFGSGARLVVEQNVALAEGVSERVVGLEPDEVSDADRKEIARVFREIVREALDAWNEPDGCRCGYHEAMLERDLSLLRALGVRTDRWPEPRPMTPAERAAPDGERYTIRVGDLFEHGSGR
jgi:hypothetical protein